MASSVSKSSSSSSFCELEASRGEDSFSDVVISEGEGFGEENSLRQNPLHFGEGVSVAERSSSPSPWGAGGVQPVYVSPQPGQDLNVTSPKGDPSKLNEGDQAPTKLNEGDQAPMISGSLETQSGLQESAVKTNRVCCCTIL